MTRRQKQVARIIQNGGILTFLRNSRNTGRICLRHADGKRERVSWDTAQAIVAEAGGIEVRDYPDRSVMVRKAGA